MNEKELQAYIERINKKLKYYYGDAYKRMLNLPEVQSAIKKGTEDFKFSNYTTHKVDKIVAELTQIINTNLQKGIANAWSYGIDNTNNHLSNAFGRLNEDYKTEIDKTVLQATKDLRDKTKESYRIVNEKKGGINLSQRVWNYNDQIKKEMEIAIQNGIKQGKSADDIARDMKKYLNNPNALFRRVRNKETGELELSKAAKEYHPGQGVYRSAYKNAMRLITTEVNAAYREAEWQSYQNNPLIKGYEIRLSNNHTILRNGKRVPFYDICDELQGIYPKTFKWTMWHPHCRCVMIPILLTEKEFASRVKARKDGNLNEWKADEIKDMPENYNKYIKENKDRLDKLKNKPSWLIDDKLNEESPNENNIKEATTKE